MALLEALAMNLMAALQFALFKVMGNPTESSLTAPAITLSANVEASSLATERSISREALSLGREQQNSDSQTE